MKSSDRAFCGAYLYEVLTERRDDLAVILAGQEAPVRKLLQSSPADPADTWPPGQYL